MTSITRTSILVLPRMGSLCPSSFLFGLLQVPFALFLFSPILEIVVLVPLFSLFCDFSS